jgi:hypothetical protein
MPIIGSAELEVSVNATEAIASLESMRGAFKKFAEGVRQELEGIGDEFDINGILKSFDVSGAKEGFAVISTVIGDLEGKIRQLSATSKGIELFPQFADVIPQLEAVQQKLREGLGEPIGTLREREAVQRSLFELETQAAHEVAAAKEQSFQVEKQQTEEIRNIRQELFLQETEEAHQLAIERRKAWEASAKAAEEAADRELKAQEKVGAELNAAINRVNPALAKDRQREFDILAAKASGVTEASGKLSGAFDHLAQRGGFLGGVAGKLGGIFGKAEGALASFGFSISDVSILLGTGFAGGVAGVILIAAEFIKKIGEMIEAVVKFGIEAAKIGSQFIALQANIEATFGDSADIVRRFSEVTTLAFGVSQTAALDYLNSVGQLLQSFDISEGAASRMSIALFKVAEGLRRGHEASVTFEQALKDVQDVIAGNLEATRTRLNFTQNEEDLKRIAEGLKDVGISIEGSFTSGERALLSLLGLVEEARARLERIPEAPRTLNEIFEVTRAVIDDVIKDLGTQLAPILTKIADLMLGFVIVMARGVVFWLKFIDGIRAFIKDSPVLLRIFHDLVEGLKVMFPILYVAAKIMKLFTDNGAAARKEAKAFADELSNLDGISDTVIDSLRGLNDETELTAENLQQLADAHVRYQRAVEDADKSITDAELNLARAREDALERTRDVNQQNQRSLQDANEKIEDANIKLQRAREDRQRKLEETLLEHNRKTEDLNRDHNRKLQDFAREEKKIRDQAAFDIVSAFRAIEDAQREDDVVTERAARQKLNEARGGGDLKDFNLERERELEDFRRNAAREHADRIRDLNDLEIESNRQIFDANKALQEAFEDRQRAFEDAIERLDDLERENSRHLFDAQQRLEDAHIRAKRSIDDAAQALDRLNDKFDTEDLTLGEILDKLERMKNAIIDINNIVKGDPFRIPLLPGTIPVAQHGMRNSLGGWTVVGEKGPELVNLPKGSDVFSHPDSRRMVQQGEPRIIAPVLNIHHADRDEEDLWFAISARLAQESTR